jgi:PIN domain nuclease of toxin-antitoxin system
MNYLLDTHTFLWFIEGSSNLSKKARSAIENSQNKNYISIASIWEMAIKLSIGRLKLDVDIEDLKQEILKNNFEILPLDFEHIIKLTSLDVIHKDPFDRILISQAIFEGLIIISKDSNFELYKKVKLLW